MIERWLPVIGYEGLYEVSDLGGVKSLDHTTVDKNGRLMQWSGRQMRVSPGKNGYPRVRLTKSGEQANHSVHHLVLEAFVGPRPFPEAYGRHLNDQRLDNRLSNLAWGTASENNHDRVRNGRHPARNKTHCAQGHPFDENNTHWYIAKNGRPNRACRTCSGRRQAA